MFIYLAKQKNEFPSSRGKNTKAEEGKGISVLIKHIHEAALEVESSHTNFRQ